MREFDLSDASKPDSEINTMSVKLEGYEDDVRAFVREMTSQERDQRVDEWWKKRLEVRKQETSDDTGREAWIAAASLCKQDGAWIAPDSLTINELCDKLLLKKSSTVRRILIATQELNGIGKAETERIEKK